MKQQIEKAKNLREHIREEIAMYCGDNNISPIIAVGAFIIEIVNIAANMACADKNPVKEFAQLNSLLRGIYDSATADAERHLCKMELEGKNNG